MIEEWKIERTRKKCETCSTVFGAAQEFYSGIVSSENAFVRRDFCRACWNPQKEPYFSFWKTSLPAAEDRPKENVEVIQDFFRKLCAETELDPEKQKLRYLLGLLLMRRRRLKLVRNDRRDGTDILILEKSWDGETMELPDPNISETELDTLKAKLETLLDVTPAAASPDNSAHT